MSEPLDIVHLVLSAILEACPTTQIEQNLSESANLEEDLGLSRDEIVIAGLTVERELQYLGLPALTDQQILSWKTVQDMIDTIIQSIE